MSALLIGDDDPGADVIQVMTMKADMPAHVKDEKEGGRIFYGAATRATQRLVMRWATMRAGFLEKGSASCQNAALKIGGN